MKTQLALIATVALLAAASIPSTAMTLFGNPTVYVIDQNATSWADAAGMGFGDATSDGDLSGTQLDKVVVTGKRISNLEVIVVNSVTFTSVGNRFDPPPLQQYTFDSRDQGITISTDQAPNPDDKAKCVTNCANVLAAANALCDSRAAIILETATGAAATAKIGRYIPRYGKYIPKDAPEKIFDGGVKASVNYNAMCKGEAGGKYNDCVHGTCKA